MLPPKAPGQENVLIKDARSIVVVGANGTGKTRLGAFLEAQAGAKAQRISAQRILNIPPLIQPRAYEYAENMLRFGTYQTHVSTDHHLSYREGNRWSSQPHTTMLNDYEHVLALLFADEERRNREYARAATATVPTTTAPKCKLDALAAIWATVMPQRQLTFTDAQVKAHTAGGTPYEGRYMSDGERVAIYLIGQALCAPADGILIVDEPETHLHRAIQALLWDQIETARADCTFVYITHDLEFAATRIGGRRIWLKEFGGTDWIWEEIGAASALPDALTMQILGTRRPILFVEGDETSHDASIYTALFPKEHVVPRQSSEKVIEATKAMAALPTFHHLKVRGLVDRDRRGDAEVAALKAANVLVADVAEVENLLCIPEAIIAVATRLTIDPPTAMAAAQGKVLDELHKQRDHQAISRALAEIQFRMNGFAPKSAKPDAVKLEAELNAYFRGIDVGANITTAKSIFDDVLAKKDYLAALKYFNSKGIVSFVANAIGFKTDLYIAAVMGILKSDPSGVVAEAMRKLIGA